MSQEPHIQESNKTAKHSNSTIPSYIWAFVFATVIAGWMFSGTLFKGDATPKNQSSNETVKGDADSRDAEQGKKLFRVQVETFRSERRRANLVIRGRTEVDARVEVKAETAGVVEQVLKKKGVWVKKGDLLCRVETAERDAALLQAKAKLAETEADYKANAALAKRGHTAALKVTSIKAQLDAAKAALKRAQLDLDRTTIDAPFNGFVEKQEAKVGDFLNTGSTCAVMVALDPLIVVGTVSELEVVNLRVGIQAHIKLISGEIREGKIRFISSSANKETRTFRIEVEISNKEAELRDGLTADIDIPLKLTNAHRLSSTILVLDEKGQIGVRTVDEKNLVRFVPVKLLSDSPKGVWVAGLPDTVRVITAGQEYVAHGQKVHVSDQTSKKNKATAQGS